MSSLLILTEHFTDRLRRAIAPNLEWYKLADSWAEEFGADSGKWELATSVEPILPAKRQLDSLLAAPDGDDLKDLENAVRLHKALPGLTPAQARDPRLWTRLTHVEFWRYMRTRWQVEKHLADRKKAERYISQHYFVSRAEGRALLRNGIARLWWFSYLTYDKDRDDPYELTAVLLKTLDIAKLILENSMGRCRAVLFSFLEFLLENPVLLEGGDRNRTGIRGLAKSLNLLGGVAVLDCLTTGTIKAHMTRELKRLGSNETAAV